LAGTAVAISNVVTADQTPVATATTGDVRGTIAVTATGAARLVVLSTTPIHQAKVSTNIDARGIFGVVNA